MAILCWAGMGLAGTCHAVELESTQASRSGSRYIVELVMVVDTPESVARTILQDPDRVVRVNDELVDVQHLPANEVGVRRFRDHTIACVWLFCVDYHNTIRMRVLDNGDIRLTVEPEKSKFKYGKFIWKIQSLGPERTRLTFYAETIPGFWVPSSGILQSRMKKGLQRMAIRMECEYRGDRICAQARWVDSTQQ